MTCPRNSLTMELFRTRRWATGSAQQSNNYVIMPYMCCIIFFGLTQTQQLLLWPIQPSYPTTKELHGLTFSQQSRPVKKKYKWGNCYAPTQIFIFLSLSLSLSLSLWVGVGMCVLPDHRLPEGTIFLCNVGSQVQRRLSGRQVAAQCSSMTTTTKANYWNKLDIESSCQIETTLGADTERSPLVLLKKNQRDGIYRVCIVCTVSS